MSIIDMVKIDIAPVGAIWTFVGLSELSTNDIMQRLMWTLAIVVSVITIVRYLYRFYIWCKNREEKYYDDDD